MLQEALALLDREPDVVPHAVLEGELARQNRRMRRKRLRRLRVRALEEHAVGGEPIDVRGLRAGVAVRGQPVRPQRVDGDDDDRPRGRGRARRPEERGGRRREDDEPRGPDGAREHRSAAPRVGMLRACLFTLVFLQLCSLLSNHRCSPKQGAQPVHIPAVQRSRRGADELLQIWPRLCHSPGVHQLRRQVIQRVVVRGIELHRALPALDGFVDPSALQRNGAEAGLRAGRAGIPGGRLRKRVACGGEVVRLQVHGSEILERVCVPRVDRQDLCEESRRVACAAGTRVRDAEGVQRLDVPRIGGRHAFEDGHRVLQGPGLRQIGAEPDLDLDVGTVLFERSAKRGDGVRGRATLPLDVCEPPVGEPHVWTARDHLPICVDRFGSPPGAVELDSVQHQPVHVDQALGVVLLRVLRFARRRAGEISERLKAHARFGVLVHLLPRHRVPERREACREDAEAIARGCGNVPLFPGIPRELVDLLDRQIDVLLAPDRSPRAAVPILV